MSSPPVWSQFYDTTCRHWLANDALTALTYTFT